ncbi:MAG: metal-dependent hydrolase [Candidatus Woesearchaeota archaeon]
MRAETHAITALLIALTFGFTLPQALVALLASLLPDIDTAESKLGRRTKYLSWLLKFGLEHRGPIHSFLFMIICAAILQLYIPAFVLPFILGYTSHLILDSLNYKGTRPFWPLGYRIKGFIKNGSIMEYTLLITIITVFLILHWT